MRSVKVSIVRVEGAACLLRTAGRVRVKKIRELFFFVFIVPL